MPDQFQPPMTILQPGQGQAGDLLPGLGVTFKFWGRDTGDALSVVEHPFEVGTLVPPHLHTREDEYSIVTAGEIGFRSGDREVVLGAGGYITKPRGEMHAMWNAGKVPARMIEIISPAGFEEFFRDLTELAAEAMQAGETTSPVVVAEIAARYGLEYGSPDWLPDIVQRYGLNPPLT